jgi:YD repeat-containing protein
MTTRLLYDFANRLTGISPALNSTYLYNLAGQRVSVTNGDGSCRVFPYDALRRERTLTGAQIAQWLHIGSRDTLNNHYL